MTRRRRDEAVEAVATQRGALSFLTSAAFFLALILVIARALSLETLRDPFEISPGSDVVPRTLTASASVLLDWVAFVPALLVLARRALDRTFRLRFAWSFVPLALLAVWAALSTRWSNDRFAAAVGVSHFVASVALFWAMIQVVPGWRRLRLVAATCFGLLLAMTAYGLIYRFVELPDLQRSVEREWTNILQKRGWEPDSFTARQFHKKVMSGEMVGFSTSPNTFAAMVVTLSIVGMGVFIQRLANRDAPAWAILLALGLLPVSIVIYYTRSKAAYATPVLAAACFAVIAIGRPLIARHHARVFVAVLALIVLCAALIVGYGIKNNNLAQDSLNFRWRYWTGAARIVREHPLVGIGWNNFGARYLAVREPAAAEEIKDPHNFCVRIVSELGFVGLALGLAWLITMWWQMTRPRELIQPGEEPSISALPAMAWIAVGAMLVNVLFSLDLVQDPSWVFIEMLKRLQYAGLILIGLIIAGFESFERQRVDVRPAPWVRSGVLVALGIFLLHNTIDFSFFETGPMWTFMLLAGAVLGTQTEAGKRSSRALAAGALGILGTAWITVAVMIVVPLLIADSKAQSADELVRTHEPGRAVKQLLDAHALLPFSNSDYLFRAARAQAMSGTSQEDVRDTLVRAIAEDPTSPAALNMLARLEASLPRPDPQRVVSAFDRALAIDPNDVTLRITYAETLERLAMKMAAISQYRIALEKNDLLDRTEPKRLAPQRVDQIRARITQLGN